MDTDRDSLGITSSSHNQNTISSPITENERSIYECSDPIEITEREEMSADGYSGLLLNRKECEAWQG